MFNNMYGNYIPPYAPQMQRLQQMEQQYPQYAQPQSTIQPQMQPQPLIGLQGKSVDSIDVVKAMDIPLDGSISYFPLTDGTAIVTKQLQNDGTSKTIIYKPVEMKEPKEDKKQFITRTEFDDLMKNEPTSIKELKEEFKDFKRKIRDLTEDIKELKRKD